MSQMGTKIDQFAIPVCRSFQAKIHNEQICYEIDLQRFSNPKNIERELELGFAFIMDYNEDRQITFDSGSGFNLKNVEVDGLVKEFVKDIEDESSLIYLNTIGEHVHTDLQARVSPT